MNRPRSLLSVTLDAPDHGHERPGGDPHGGDLQVFPETGYYVISNPRRDMKMVFDCGEVGIQQVAGHAHSDLLSYELSVAGERVVVDSGTSIYASCARRQFERGISAHNTVSVDGTDTCEPWGDYRMARRGRPGEVRTFEQDGFVIIDAGHESFIGLSGIRHRRAIISTEDILVVFDRILGAGAHSVEAQVLFHPAVRLDRLEHTTPAYMVSGNTAHLVVRCFGAKTSVLPASEDRLRGWYAPSFGKLLPSNSIRMNAEGPLPLQIGHTFSAVSTNVQYCANEDTWKVVMENRGSDLELKVDSRGVKTNGLSKIDYEWL